MPRICMLVLSYYPYDPRPRREAEAMISAGFQVDIICLKGEKDPFKETIDGVNVYRMPVKRKRSGKIRYFWEYSIFFSLSFLMLSLLYIRKRYSLIHVHNMPEFLVYCALIPRLMGSKIILDLHDPTPEVYLTKYNINPAHLFYRFFVYIEKKSIQFSHLVLTPNLAFYNLFINRSCPEHKINIIMNSPDENIFHINKTDNVEKTHDSKFIIMYHGFIAERNGLDIALDAISMLSDKIPGIVFNVYGEGDFTEQFLKRTDELNIGDVVNYYGPVPLETIAKRIELIDIGIIPNKKTPFTEINLPTRIFEYLCKGKPVIASRTKGILDYFDEESIFFFEPGNPVDLSEKILEVYNNPLHVQKVLERGIAVQQLHSWKNERKYLVELVRNLLNISVPENGSK